MKKATSFVYGMGYVVMGVALLLFLTLPVGTAFASCPNGMHCGGKIFGKCVCCVKDKSKEQCKVD